MNEKERRIIINDIFPYFLWTDILEKEKSYMYYFPINNMQEDDKIHYNTKTESISFLLKILQILKIHVMSYLV